MLKKINRICKKNEFEEVKSKGEMKATELFSIVWLKKSGEKAFGAIISKKISKKAVDRNQIRRRLMEAVRLNMDIFPQGFRGIFLVKKNILKKSETEVEECLKKLF
ncbi:MAG: Ribonuclease P protein component [Candidatus Shapirobacteria bacterium GW2011_GWE1_38_10]|uniref:Ribonuclease P protein component n=1 Tax=Candidatus Shapirobacteria bacterium GW2011_GWE1_38_10 TaxID=1618488 RepID=A0A0G0I5A8_9BACT|nr:MAG: Ribonuclease P protein component [Candidatus Shapirobacteria bacterium GW2011_GWF2_37_20]KKQ50528.1 MAG: Ribonuclease P protein component [Candidatus Shapirobacteria bacterium GW2011_GWE1_38_10]KKQ64669.1 MAG: Ribonuclease P protein component [Candidatus Shapirobacteria bacterium GW2011_GWF1_38_23]